MAKVRGQGVAFHSLVFPQFPDEHSTCGDPITGRERGKVRGCSCSVRCRTTDDQTSVHYLRGQVWKGHARKRSRALILVIQALDSESEV